MALSTEWVALKNGQSGSGGVEYSSEELLGNEYNTNNMFWKTNGSQIIRIVDKYIVASTTIGKTDHFYVCNIESGHCTFVK